MNQVLSWLRAHEPFASLPDTELARLARSSRLRHTDRGEVIVRSGSPQTEIVYVVEGTTTLYRANKGRTVTILLGVLSAPSVFGDAECASGSPWMVSARAETDTVTLMIANEAFMGCVQRNGALAYRMYMDASVRLAIAGQTAHSLALYSVDVRLIRTLLDYARRYGRSEGDDVHVGRKLAQPELAAAVGTTTKTVKRTVDKLKKEGVLAVGPTGTLILRNIQDLRNRMPENIYGLCAKLGSAPPPVFSDWQSGFEGTVDQDALETHAKPKVPAP